MNNELEKLQLLKDEPALAIFDELNLVNQSLKTLIEATNASKTENVVVDNLSDAKTDLTPLERNFEALKRTVETVTDAIKNIEPAKEINVSGIEKLLSKIASVEQKDIDVSELKNISDILDNVLFAVQTLASHTNNKKEEVVPELKSIQEILNVVNKNIVSIDSFQFDYEKLARIIKDNLNINVSGGGANTAGIEARQDTTNTKLDTLISTQQGLSGAGTDTNLTLTLANTAYAIPTSPPVSPYTLIIYNVSDSDIYFRFTTGITMGTKIASGDTLLIDFSGNQGGFVYCASAGKILNVSYKII